jgi:hypothetical protein
MRCIICEGLGRGSRPAEFVEAGYSVCGGHVGDGQRAARSGLAQTIEWIELEQKQAAERAAQERNTP